jgi:hypothetical protein
MANVQILKLCFFYNEGERGARGGAASNDKVWGAASVDNKLVAFWGRRNGKLKFKTYFKSELEKLLEKYAEKIGGRTDVGDIYTPANSKLMQSFLTPNLERDITQHFYKDLRAGKVNTQH